MRMLLSSALIVLLSLGCQDTRSPVAPAPSEPEAPSRATASSQEPLPVTGCAVFSVDVSDPANVTLQETAEPDCERVRPVLDGQATLDSTGLVLRIPIALENGGPTPLEPPAHLWSADNLLQVIGGGAAGEEGLLLFLNADSTELAVTDGEEVVRYVWRYDDQFLQQNGTSQLDSEGRSASRVIEIALDPSVQEFRIEMHGQAMIPTEWVVPEVTPETAPDWLYEHQTSNSPVISGTFLKNILFVIFRPGTSQAERQAAVDSVRGRVVGGIRDFGDDGYYIVLVEENHPDVPGQALLDARDTLNGLPQVDLASPEFVFQKMDLYRRPGDGPGWGRGVWALRTEGASGGKWGLERIAAPLGWGCSIGSDSVSVAVVDRGFRTVSDITGNVKGGFGLGVFPDTVDHGIEVAAVLAASGDNDTLITGVMWRAGLHLYEVGVDSTGTITRDTAGQPETRLREVLKRIDQAANAGAHVINLSQGVDTASFRNPGASAPRGDSIIVETVAAQFHRRIQRLETAGFRPLFVLGAGNGDRNLQGIDAYWSGFPAVRDSFPDRVLVVAASEQNGAQDQLATFSNRGSLVEIAAPGVGISTLDGSGNIVSRNGTSVAAPFVSGVAGLLASFDPQLTAPELKQHILEGAARGNRSAGGIPLLNAYESLRGAAEQPGAPLCGQEVWAADGKLWARRGGAPVELAGAGDPAAQVEVLHGGKFILHLIQDGGQIVGRVVQWDAVSRSWIASGIPSDWQQLRGGTHASVFGRSHERDTLAWVDGSAVNQTRWYDSGTEQLAQILAQEDGGSAEQVGQIEVENLPDPVQVTCLERDPDTHACFLTIRESRAWLFRLGYPQFPEAQDTVRHAPVTVSPLQVLVVDSTVWEPCGTDPSHECRTVNAVQDHVHALLYRMELTAGASAPAPLETVPEETVFWIGEGENGEDAVLMRGRWAITLQAHADTFHATGSPFFGSQSELERCVIEYRRRADLSSKPGSGPIPVANACDFGSLDRPSTGAGGGTISPSVVPAETIGREGGTAGLSGPIPLPILAPTSTGLQEIGS